MPPSNFFKIHFNIICPSMPISPSDVLPSGFPTKALDAPLPFPYVMHALPILFFSELNNFNSKLGLGMGYGRTSLCPCVHVVTQVLVFHLYLVPAYNAMQAFSYFSFVLRHEEWSVNIIYDWNGHIFHKMTSYFNKLLFCVYYTKSCTESTFYSSPG